MRYKSVDYPYRIILASASPRREELMKALGFDFSVIIPAVDELVPDNTPVEKAPEFLALQKSNAVVEHLLDDETMIITADTMVVQNNTILPKPADYDEACKILMMLSGKEHKVITGVCLKSLKKCLLFSSCSKVWFNELSPDAIDFYVTNYKPYDKAGAYGIQDWIGYIGIHKIEGSFYNVMGLPTQQLYDEMMRF
jgi:septum formation protein